MSDSTNRGGQSQGRPQGQSQKQSHVILCGKEEERNKIVDQLKGQNIQLESHPTANKVPGFHRFDGKGSDWEPTGQTFDQIGIDSALYLIQSPTLVEQTKQVDDPTWVEQTKQVDDPTSVEEIKQVNSPTLVNQIREAVSGELNATACRDRLLTGPDISPNENPGVSPGGTPRWLDDLSEDIVAQISQQFSPPQDKGNDPDIAIIILDTSPAGLDGWKWADDVHNRLVDGWADFTELLVRDPDEYREFQKRVQNRSVWRETTENIGRAVSRGVQHHGLIVASLCRRDAPPGTKVILLRVQDDNGVGTVHSLCSAMRYALYLRDELPDREKRLPKNLIFNLSLGLPNTEELGVNSQHLLSTINDVLNAGNTVVVCAAGNTNALLLQPEERPKAEDAAGNTNALSSQPEERPNAEEPAAYNDIQKELEHTDLTHLGIAQTNTQTQIDPLSFQQRLLNVGATDRSETTVTPEIRYAPFSKQSDLAAPGMNLLLHTWQEGKGDQLLIWNGTSFAVPQVSGLVAHLLARAPELQNIRGILYDTGDRGLGGFPCQINPGRAIAEVERLIAGIEQTT
jgi:hypothetical protein